MNMTALRSRQTVLMVDDTPANLAVLGHVLEESGLHVLVAQDGEEAVERARLTRPDLILLDVMMPGIDGFETCRRLKADCGLSDVPVIFMTALSDSTNRLRAFEVGGVDYVTKPIESAEVLARINTHLTLRAMQCRLSEQNDALQKEIGMRRQVEDYLQHAYELMEERVLQRTGELARANALLTAEIKERTRAEESLRRNEARVRRLVESNIIGIYFWEASGRIVEANDAFLQMVGYNASDIADGRLEWEHLSPADAEEAAQHVKDELKRHGSIAPYEREYLRRDGSRVPVLVGATAIGDGTYDGVAFVLDLSERRRAEERIRYLASHDALTGLPNRTLLQDRLHQAIAQAQRTSGQVGVLFIDLDYFKHINDSLGHPVGDCLLREVAARLRHCVRDGDTVARLGGDEFVLVLPLASDGTDAALVAAKALEALDAPIRCDEHDLHVSGSIGISLYPGDGADVDALMRAADTAMYHAKEKGRSNYQFFTSAMNRTAQHRHAMTSALRRAIALDQLVLHYQPQVDLETGTIFSAEALLRWRQPDGSQIACNEFITIAEENGLILPIGEWVLREASGQLKRWRELGFGDLTVAVNLSPRQFFQPAFLETVGGILEEAGVPANRIDLEITESLLMQRSEENLATLQQLSRMGIKLSIDDFGTGYSSLSYLQRFPVDALKIDRSFVSRIGQDSSDTALVSAIISMAHSLRLKVLAEGVETPEQVDFLRTHGCLSAQGFYYSRAIPADDFTTLMRKQHQFASA